MDSRTNLINAEPINPAPPVTKSFIIQLLILKIVYSAGFQGRCRTGLRHVRRALYSRDNNIYFKDRWVSRCSETVATLSKLVLPANSFPVPRGNYKSQTFRADNEHFVWGTWVF